MHHPNTSGTGDAARLTRVVNPTLTPVTHELLPSAAAAGQLSAEDLQRLRVDQGLLPKQRFYLFGHPVQNSPSRVLHSTGFRGLHLPNTCVEHWRTSPRSSLLSCPALFAVSSLTLQRVDVLTADTTSWTLRR